jgi:MFS family permease
MTASTPFDRARMRRARVAVSLAFLAFGTQLGLWFAHIPEVAKRLSLEPARLGVGILSIGVVGLAMQSVAGVAIARFGSRRTTIVLLPAFVLTETLLIQSPSQPAFFVFAALVGLVGMPANVGNNTLAAELERLHGRPVMSSFHGFFSVGGLVGSLLGGALIATGHGDGRGAIVVGVVLLVVSLWATANALEVAPAPGARNRGEGPRFAIPAVAILGICLLVFCTTLIEGSIGDWSALYLDTIKHADPALAASGYAMFSVAMAVVRFAGGPIVERLGRKALIVAGGCLMAAGMLIVVLAPWPVVSALGFLVVAVGASNISPILTSAAANLPGVPPSIGVAALTTFMTLGLFAGPPAIGFIAQAWDLGLGFGLLAVLGVMVAIGAAVRRWDPAPAPDAGMPQRTVRS